MPEQPQSAIARARVQVTLEITLPDRWDPGCTLEQLEDQARRRAVEMVIAGPLGQAESGKSFRILSPPTVTAILFRRGELADE